MYYLAHIVQDSILQKPNFKLKAQNLEQTIPILAGTKAQKSSSCR
jgi:hypothetical protein